ncbi:thrombospondin type 3 repeat-containing protein [Arenicella xantha]|uniref:Thrombospondin type 3 repeat-containing protein n=1 Tax=Arenicella xantha TaxID=644221 RepID=A0A395JIG4_9GAMM|nr:thrombospondin type 3 repeat-containing protein [Arenicella xantha]
MSGNSAYPDTGGGLYTREYASISVSNSIIANSAGGACGGTVSIAIATDSIVDDSSCSVATVADPLLGPLADNGGATLTHALMSGSPAINPGSSVNPTSTDQRGFAAVGTRDVGAFEVQSLSVSVSPDVMPENGGASTGTVTRSVLIDRPLEVNLASSDLSSAMVPTSVVIPAGEASATFAISAVDDTLADGNSISSISVNAIGYVVGSATVTVVDNETPSLGLTLNSSSISESGITVATVSRNTPTNTALNVSLSSNNPTRLVIPATVEIPVGAAFVNFNITGIDNTTLDADQLVTIAASGLGSVTANLLVTDDDDDDADGIADNADNCPSTPNPNQDDFEGDGIGDACDNDIDGDGMPNQYELDNGLDPRNSFDRDADPDGDGFTNLEEFEFSTDPNVPNPDDDNDGIPDDALVDTPQRRFPLPAILPLLLDE